MSLSIRQHDNMYVYIQGKLEHITLLVHVWDGIKNSYLTLKLKNKPGGVPDQET